jgi:hypothetical protein
MSDELKDGYLLRYEEAFNKKKATFENTKVILHTLQILFISLQILQVYLFFF